MCNVLSIGVILLELSRRATSRLQFYINEKSFYWLSLLLSSAFRTFEAFFVT